MTPGAPFDGGAAEAPEGGEGWWLTAADGTRLRAVVWRRGRRGTVAIFPGRTEFSEKYGRVVGELVARDLAVMVIDWRGQGLSDRHPRNAMLGHVRDFADYQRDVAALLGLAAGLDLPQPRYLVAHSMGGAVGLRALLEHGGFAGAVFSAPMWGLNMGAATRRIAGSLTAVAGRIGFGDLRMPGTRKRSAAAPRFEGNLLTSDPMVFDWCLAQAAAHPELTLGAPSVRWTGEALRESTRLAAGPVPELPVLVLLGSDELVVSPAAIRGLVARMAQAEIMELAGARHEILMERPDIQSRVWARVDAFLEEAPARRRRSAASGN